MLTSAVGKSWNREDMSWGHLKLLAECSMVCQAWKAAVEAAAAGLSGLELDFYTPGKRKV